MPYPHPSLRDFKGLFVLGDFGQWLFFFEFAFFYEALFLGLNLGIKLLGSPLLRALLYQFALDGKLQNTVFEFLRGHSATPPRAAVISARTRSISAFSEARCSS